MTVDLFGKAAGCSRQGEPEFAALPWGALDPAVAPQTLHNPANDGQPQTMPFPIPRIESGSFAKDRHRLSRR